MSDPVYRQGNILGKRGTILPRSADFGREHSGTVFDVNRPLEQNIVEMDASGNSIVHHLDAAAVEKATQAARAGKVVDPTTFGRKVSAPVSPTYHRVLASPDLESDVGEANTGLPFIIQDDTASPFGDYSNARVEQVKSESIPKSGGKGVLPPASIPAVPLQAGTTLMELPLVSATEVEKHLASPPPLHKRVIAAYEPVVEKPNDLDKEPNAAPGPERLSSYTVERRTSAEDSVPEPLLVPQMETAPVKSPVIDEPFKNTKDYESTPKTSYANLQAQPMRKAKVKVRFKSAMGSLAVAYNVVFKEGIKLIMVQHDVEGLFYEPPGDNETPVEIQWHGDTYVCYSALNFKMPDEQTAFNIYLIDAEATAGLKKG